MDRLAKSSDAMRIVTAARLAKDHQKFFQEHGWTYEEFLNTAQQLLQAYAAVETKESLKECRKGFESQRAEAMLDIQKNSNMTPEQKQMMLQYIKQAEESIKMAEAAFKDVPPANLELARKYREAIAGVLKAFD